MKKIIFIAVLTFLGITHAQVTFKPGFRAGLNFSHFTKGNDEFFYEDNLPDNNDRNFSSKTDFYLGLTGAIKLTKYYTLQPELNYSRQGSNLRIIGVSGIKKLNISYISPTITNKFTLNGNLNLHVGATIDLQVDADFKTDSDLDLTLFLGAGYNFTKNFGIEARVKKGIIPVLDYSDGNHTNVVFSFGGTYTFDLK